MSELQRVLAEIDALRQEMRLRPALQPLALTVAETARTLACSEPQVWVMLKDGRLRRGKKAGRRTTVTVKSIQAFQAEEVEIPLPKKTATKEQPPSLVVRSPEELRRALKSVRV